MIYDTSLNITWLSDWNYSKTSGVKPDGIFSWAGANAWADSLVYGGFDDWRLPTALNGDGTRCPYAYNCDGSEMGHLFYVDLGGRRGESVLNQAGDSAEQIADLALFRNVQAEFFWSGTEVAGNTALAYDFYMYGGGQLANEKANGAFAMAVRDGDVAAAPAVPEPGTVSMLLAGLGLLGVVSRRGHTRQSAAG